jgi:hypothetical protein
MKLNIQIFTSIYSFLFGIFFELSYLFLRKILYCKKKYISYPFTLIFTTLFSYIYYLVLEHVNNGILHPYSILLIIISCIITYCIFTKLTK